jgi:hypothetical protein
MFNAKTSSLYFLFIIFFTASLNAHVFEKAISAISEKTSIAPETIKNWAIGTLIIGAVASLVGGAVYLDHRHNKQLQLAENNKTDQEIITEEMATLKKYTTIFAQQLNLVNDIEQLKKAIIEHNSFPYFLHYKNKIISAINACEMSIQRIDNRLNPEFAGNTNDRNISGFEMLKQNFEMLINNLCNLRNAVNDCISSSFFENILFSWIKNRTYDAKYWNGNNYYFAYLAEDVI